MCCERRRARSEIRKIMKRHRFIKMSHERRGDVVNERTPKKSTLTDNCTHGKREGVRELARHICAPEKRN